MRKRRDFPAAITSFIIFGILIFFIINFGPDKNMKILNLDIPTIPLFFILFFAGAYEFFKFLLNQQRGLLIAFFLTLYLILRLNNLTHPIFAILIVALFITFELLFKRRK